MSMPAGIKTCGIRVEAAPAPWLPAGDLTLGNVADAIWQSGTPAMDVSFAVEDAPGINNRR